MLICKLLNYMHFKCVSTCTIRYKTVFSFMEYNKAIARNIKYRKYSASNNGPWKVLFFGNDTFSLQSLIALNTVYKAKGLLQCLEVVSTDKETPLVKYAKECNIKVHLWPPEINEKDFDIGVIVSFGHLIPSRIINLFPLGMINVHGSLLPKWRGAAPIAHALMNGETQTGITIFKILPKKFDIGEIVAQKGIEIYPEETHPELETKLASIGADLLVETMTKLPDVLKKSKPQAEEGITYAPKIKKDISFIRWKAMTAKNVYDLQRGLKGIEPLRSYFSNEIVKLVNVKPVEESTSADFSNYVKEVEPGTIMFNKKNKSLYVLCKGGSWITIDTIIFRNSKPKSAVQFSSGYILNDKSKSHKFY